MGFKTISAHVETGLATPSLAPQNQVLLQDVDEQLFVNYLSATSVEDPQPATPHVWQVRTTSLGSGAEA